MKLRVHRTPPHGGAPAAASLMLRGHAGGDAWCRVDAGSGGDVAAPVVLTGLQRERVDGLLDLRNGAPINLYATPAVFEHLTLALPLLPVLQQFCGVQWHLIPVAGEQRSADFSIDRMPSLVFTAMTAGEAAPGERIALAVRDGHSGARLFVAHGASLEGSAGELLFDWMQDADCIVVDRAPRGGGTRWLDRLARVAGARKLLLDADGSDRSRFAECGVECADRTMELEL